MLCLGDPEHRPLAELLFRFTFDLVAEERVKEESEVERVGVILAGAQQHREPGSPGFEIGAAEGGCQARLEQVDDRCRQLVAVSCARISDGLFEAVHIGWWFQAGDELEQDRAERVDVVRR